MKKVAFKKGAKGGRERRGPFHVQQQSRDHHCAMYGAKKSQNPPSHSGGKGVCRFCNGIWLWGGGEEGETGIPAPGRQRGIEALSSSLRYAQERGGRKGWRRLPQHNIAGWMAPPPRVIRSLRRSGIGITIGIARMTRLPFVKVEYKYNIC